MEGTKTESISGFPLLISAFALGLATFLIVLDYSIANVSIPYIAGDLGVSVDEGTYIITAFAVGSAIILPITGWLTKKIGLVRLITWSLIGFAIFSWVCGASLSLPMLVGARFFQGIIAGPLIPASQSLIISIFPEEKKTRALTIWSTVVIVGPIVGPIAGGWITYDFHWPWIFYMNIPLSLFSTFVISTFLRPFETKRENPPTDWLGIFLLAIAVSTLQFTLDKGEQYDWLNSPIICICIAISAIAFIYLFVWEWLTKHPSLELKLLKIPGYALSVFLIAVMYATYFGSVVLLPLWLQESMGYTPLWAGFAVAPLGVIPLFFTWVTEKIAKKIGFILPLLLASLAFSISCFASAFLTTTIDIMHVALTRLMFGAGIALFIVPVFGLSLRDLPKEKYPAGAGFFHFVRAMSGGIGTAAFTTLWIRRSAFHHANLASAILPTNDPANALYSTLDQSGFNQVSQEVIVNQMITEQASTLAINDAFYLMGWIFIILIPIIALGKRKKQHDQISSTPPSLPPSPSSQRWGTRHRKGGTQPDRPQNLEQ